MLFSVILENASIKWRKISHETFHLNDARTLTISEMKNFIITVYFAIYVNKRAVLWRFLIFMKSNKTMVKRRMLIRYEFTKTRLLSENLL